MRSATRTLTSLAMLAAAIGGASLAFSLVACGSSASSVDAARAAYDHGNPESTVLATPTDAFAAKFGISWWEAYSQNYSLVASAGYAPTPGEERMAIVFYGHDSNGYTQLSGQVVLDGTRIQSMPSGVTLTQLASAFVGTGITSRLGASLSAQDQIGLLQSVVSSVASVPAGALMASNHAPGTLSAEGVSDNYGCSSDAMQEMSSSISTAMQGNSSCGGCQDYASVLAQEPVAGAASPQCNACARAVLSELKISPSHWSDCPSDAGPLTDADLHFDANGDESDPSMGNLCDGCGGEVDPEDGGPTTPSDGGVEDGSGGDSGGGAGGSCDNSSKAAPSP
jgi:hypothetical protein